MKDLVSIIVPVYNVEKHITKCVNSIRKQTYSDIEIILINDGSTDKSGEICESIALKDSRIKVIHIINSGVGTARNIGIKEAKGRYLQFVDSDDFIDKSTTYKLINACKNEKSTVMPICGILMQQCYSDNKCIEFLPHFPKKKINIEVYYQQLFKYKTNVFFGSPNNKLFDSNIIKENKIYFEEYISLGEDFVFNIKYLHYIEEAIILNESLYFYRYTIGSLTRSAKDSLYIWNRSKEMYLIYKDLFVKKEQYTHYKNEIDMFLLDSVKSTLMNCINENRSLAFKLQTIEQIISDNICKKILIKNYKDIRKLLNIQSKIFLFLMKINEKHLLYFFLNAESYRRRLLTIM